MNLLYFELIACSTNSLTSLSKQYNKLTIQFKGIDVFQKYCQNYQEAARHQIERNNAAIIEINENICNIINLIENNEYLNEITETKTLIDNMDTQLGDFALEMFVNYMEVFENDVENITEFKTKEYDILLANKRKEVHKLNTLNKNHQRIQKTT